MDTQLCDARARARHNLRPARRRATRALRAAALLACVIGLAACGGGGDSVTFDIGVTVAGQPLSGVAVAPGDTQNVSIYAGQPIELDASEPVLWTLYVGGSSVTGSGTTVYYGGLGITLTSISDSRVVVDTAATSTFAAPVQITLVATSVIDAAQVATVNVLIQ